VSPQHGQTKLEENTLLLIELLVEREWLDVAGRRGGGRGWLSNGRNPLFVVAEEEEEEKEKGVEKGVEEGVSGKLKEVVPREIRTSLEWSPSPKSMTKKI
jgi:hypothetical protein